MMHIIPIRPNMLVKIVTITLATIEFVLKFSFFNDKKLEKMIAIIDDKYLIDIESVKSISLILKYNVIIDV